MTVLILYENIAKTGEIIKSMLHCYLEILLWKIFCPFILQKLLYSAFFPVKSNVLARNDKTYKFKLINEHH